MTRYRYLIEANTDEYEPFWLASVDAEGNSSGGCAAVTVEAAKEIAEKSEDEIVKWKTPSAAWLPDAICVSQIFDNGVKENRDSWRHDSPTSR